MKIFLFALLFPLLAGCGRDVGTAGTMREVYGDDDGFRMMVRLWPRHHDDTLLTDRLIAELGKYDFCDEVWLCFNDPLSHSLGWHAPHAEAIGVAAGKFRSAGIIASMQGVVYGHGDPSPAGLLDGFPKDSTIRWGSMVGPDGKVARTVNCPRQPEFLAHIEEAVQPYVASAHPRSLYLDDDLRVTQHPPSEEGCFCDLCVSLFNKEYGHEYTRPTLVKALLDNEGDGSLRAEWIAFGQEGLAAMVRAVSRGVHKTSPETRMGLQHTNFHHKLLEGWDWNPMFRAMAEESGHAPVSRPGHGFYNDHSPRGMIEKGFGIARQVRRLDSMVTEIAPEIEGYQHKATGKSPKGICLETMYYLSMGASQMSYAIICGSNEPLSWYRDGYFKALSEWKPFAKEYADFNKGLALAGIDPYVSPNLVYRDVASGEDPWAWAVTSAGSKAFPLAALGLPFAPEARNSLVRMVDEELVRGVGDMELSSLLSEGHLVFDNASWKQLIDRGLAEGFETVDPPSGKVPGDLDDPSINPSARYSSALRRICFLEKDGARVAVVPSYSDDITGAERLAMLRAFDWASGERIPALLESSAQSAVVPRVDDEGQLRSVAILNCSISDQDSYTMRLRACDPHGCKAPRFVWKRHDRRDIVLKPQRDGDDYILTIPGLPGWDFGWIAVLR
ncbi:MAG: hypothetical protein IKW89_08075 [Bacteroidales bacterium]|nr:hypothetical protein [Bacteroidales bacterium]